MIKNTSEYNKKIDNNIKMGFGKLLNIHGYGFQHSVLKLAESLFREGNSAWVFETSEFPVQVRGEGTRVDFVLRLKNGINVFLLAECKKANPAFSNWCFAKAPYVRRNRTTYEPLLIEYLQKDKYGSSFSSAQKRVNLNDAYHVALEVKTGEKGDPLHSGKGEIERATTQVCRGLNGFVIFTAGHQQILFNQNSAYFLPVVFTTAKIWASNVDLSNSDIFNGKITMDNTEFTEKPWIFYQYHLSPGIKHSYVPREPSNNLGDILDFEYIRSIAIVTASGIPNFLQWASNSDNYLD